MASLWIDHRKLQFMNGLELRSDTELMLEIKAGNMLAFDVLYRKYSIRLYKFAFSLVKVQEDAENIVQDVFMKLWLNRDKVDKAASVRYFVFSIAYHSSISLIRKKIMESKFTDYLLTCQESFQEPATLLAEYNELDEKLNKVIDSLPARQKEVYRLHRIEGLKYAEIAVRLDISENTIENHMSRAIKTIRDKMGDYSMIVLLFIHLFT
jgi:RNA polymerase sigma-70 factor (ECF subfamily)